MQNYFILLGSIQNFQRISLLSESVATKFLVIFYIDFYCVNSAKRFCFVFSIKIFFNIPPIDSEFSLRPIIEFLKIFHVWFFSNFYSTRKYSNFLADLTFVWKCKLFLIATKILVIFYMDFHIIFQLKGFFFMETFLNSFQLIANFLFHSIIELSLLFYRCAPGGRVTGLQEAVWDSTKSICDSCGLTGANIGCVKRGCKAVTHYPCALTKGWLLDTKQYIPKCNAHRVTWEDHGESVKVEKSRIKKRLTRSSSSIV